MPAKKSPAKAPSAHKSPSKFTPEAAAQAAASAVAEDERRRDRERARAEAAAAKALDRAALMLFPDESPQEIEDAVAARWDTAGPLPVPRFPLICPICGAPAFPRAWQIYRLPVPMHAAHAHRHPWRCDISVKCHSCSAVWAHGLAITEGQARAYGANPTTAAAAAYTWRQARDRLAGYLKG